MPNFTKYIWFNKKRDDEEKKLHAKRASSEEFENLPPRHKYLTYISFGLKLFTRENTGFRLHFSNNGSESDHTFYFIIPWLLQFQIVVQWNVDFYKRKWGELYKDDIDKNWGFSFYKSWFCLSWNNGTGYLGKSTGFFYSRDWENVFKGETKDVEWGKSRAVLHTARPVCTHYKTELYKDLGDLVKKNTGNGGVVVTVPMVVYEIVGIRRWGRWFPSKVVRYNVASEVPITVPGKGDNEWDQDDEVYHSKYDSARDDTDFSCGAKGPQEAAEAYINTIKRALIR